MRVFLHIGVWKTGSSAIQGFLRENAPALESAGIAAPTLLGRRNLARLATTGEAGLEAALGKIWSQAQAKGATALILSSEHFWPLTGPAQDRLATALQNRRAEISVLAYLRPQADMWRSLLAQQAKSFRIKLDEPIWGEVSYIGRSLASRALFYGACLSRFRRQFGLVDAQLYQRRSFPSGNVVASFADRVGISTLPGLTLSLEAEANRSLGWKGVALSIAIAEQSSRAIGSRLHRAALITAAATMARRHEDDTWFGRPPNFLTAGDIAAINHLYAEDTVKLSKRFFGGSQPFQPAAAAPVDPFGPAHLGAGELVEALSLYRRALIIEAPTVALTSLRRITE